MSVKKIFITLIVVVACVMLGALLLNVLMPNVTRSVVNAIEDTIFSATGMQFDFNGDATVGGETNASVGGGNGYDGVTTVGEGNDGTAVDTNGNNVNGFTGGVQ